MHSFQREKQRLERSITLFEAYERVLTVAPFKDLQRTIITLQTTLRQTQSATATASGLPDPSESITRTIALQCGLDKADEIRLSLAAFEPHLTSKRKEHLQERQAIAKCLRRLLGLLDTAQLLTLVAAES